MFITGGGFTAFIYTLLLFTTLLVVTHPIKTVY
jgi:hypothetical protein